MTSRVQHLVTGTALAAALVGTAAAATSDGPSIKLPEGTMPKPMPDGGPSKTMTDGLSKPGQPAPPMLPVWKPPLPLPDPGIPTGGTPKGSVAPAAVVSVSPTSGCAGTTFTLRVDRFTPGASVGALVVTPEGTELLVKPEPTDAHGRAVLTVKTSTGTPGGVYRAHVIDVASGRKVAIPYTVIAASSASTECGVLAAKLPQEPRPPKPPVVKPPTREPVTPASSGPEPPAASAPLPGPSAPTAPVAVAFPSAQPDLARPAAASPSLGTVITFALLAFLVERLTNGLVLLLGYWTWWSSRMEPRAPDDHARAERNRRVALFGLSTAVATIGAFALGVNVLRDLGIEAVQGPAALLITGLLIGAGADPIRDLITSRARPSRDSGERAAPIQVTGTLVLQQPGMMGAANGSSTVAQLHAEQGPARAA